MDRFVFAFRVAVVLAVAGAGEALGPRVLAAQEGLRTHAEVNAFGAYTPYDSMMAYLARVQASSSEMRLGVYGESHEGRDLPYALFSRPAVTRPADAWSLGKPILVLAANVHGGERTLRESVLILTREFATPGTRMNDLLDELTILVVPQINPDGFSALPGPTRGNLRGLDLNRDYMKLEQPEIQGYVGNVLLEWMPHLFIDGHNGGAFPYNLNYQCPSHAGSDARITALCDDLIFPEVERVLGTEGYRAWYYQNGNATRWEVGGTDPRIGRNYGGLANMVGVLFESPGGQTAADGVRSGLLGYRAVVEWSAANADLLMETVAAARRETVELGAIPSGEIPIDVTYAPENRTVRWLIGVGPPAERTIVEVVSDSLMKRPVTTLARARPWAYTVPREATEAIELLRRHRVEVEVLDREVEVHLDAYQIESLSYEAMYDHPAATRLEVGGIVTFDERLPRGTYIVRMDQMQGRVAAQLLEPETRDGVVYWNRMDAWIPRREVEVYRAGGGEPPLFPIYKIMTPTPLPTTVLR